MAWGLDAIKQGLADAEKAAREAAREAEKLYDEASTSESAKAAADKYDSAIAWAKTDEGQETIELALDLGLVATELATGGSISGFAATANIAYKRRKQLLALKNQVDDLAVDVADSLADTGKARAAFRAQEKKFLDMVDNQKRLSQEFFDELEKTADLEWNYAVEKWDLDETIIDFNRASSIASSKGVELAADIKKMGQDLVKSALVLGISADSIMKSMDMLGKWGGEVSEKFKELFNLSEMTPEQLSNMGMVKITAYTRSDGVKIPTHFRKKPTFALA